MPLPNATSVVYPFLVLVPFLRALGPDGCLFVLEENLQSSVYFFFIFRGKTNGLTSRKAQLSEELSVYQARDNKHFYWSMRIELESNEHRRRPSVTQNPLPRLQRTRSASRDMYSTSAVGIIIPIPVPIPIPAPAPTPMAMPTLSPSAKVLAKGPSLPLLSSKLPQLTGNSEPVKTICRPAISNLSETASGASAPKPICVDHDMHTEQTESGNAGKETRVSDLVPNSYGLQAMMTPAGNAGKDTRVSDLVPNSYGLQAKARYLTLVQAQRKSISPFVADNFVPMLKPCPKAKVGKITLVLDIDETLVHASINPRPGLRYDTVVHFDDQYSGDIYVAYRPHMHTFLRAVAPLFEVVVFTASQSCYADPLMDTIDPDKTLVTDRLYRQHCVEAQGGRIKDLNLCGRSLDRMVIIDNSPIAYCFQPRNAIPILSWFNDPNDNELLKLIPLLQRLATEESVYPLLDMYNAQLMSAQDEVDSGSPINTVWLADH
jgi:Dullard-like phosphatase family protein